MKIKSGFTTNSSSSSFLIRKDSESYARISACTDFNLKDGGDLSRSTGCYEGEALREFLAAGWNRETFTAVFEYLFIEGLENFALIIDSDEGMGGSLPSPSAEDILFETEYH